MDSYLIRIYRRDMDSPQNLVGLVEAIGAGETMPFKNLDELYAILDFHFLKPKSPQTAQRKRKSPERKVKKSIPKGVV